MIQKEIDKAISLDNEKVTLTFSITKSNGEVLEVFKAENVSPLIVRQMVRKEVSSEPNPDNQMTYYNLFIGF